MDDRYLSNFRFADDIILFANMKEELNDMFEELHKNTIQLV